MDFFIYRCKKDLLKSTQRSLTFNINPPLNRSIVKVTFNVGQWTNNYYGKKELLFGTILIR